MRQRTSASRSMYQRYGRKSRRELFLIVPTTFIGCQELCLFPQTLSLWRDIGHCYGLRGLGCRILDL